MNKQISPKLISLTFGILVILFATGFYIFAWQEPGQSPPGGNVPAPINVGSTDQSKLGGLGLGGGVGQALQWLKNIGGTLHIQNQAGISNIVIGQDGKVGIGIVSPETILDVAGTVKASGFKIPTGAGAGKVLISDASGVGTWQSAPQPPDTFGGSVLVNYGNYVTQEYYAGYSVSNCPSGWTEAGLGFGEVTYTISYGGWAQGTQIPVITESSLRPAYRTCFRADRACLVLVNYGNYVTQEYYAGYSVSNCPSGWTEAGLGYQPPEIAKSSSDPYPAYRTCFLCP